MSDLQCLYMFPFKKRNCVSALRSICFHILHHYYGLSGLLTVLLASLCLWHLYAIPLLTGNCEISQVHNQTLNSSPIIQTPAVLPHSRDSEWFVLAATVMRVSPTALLELTTLNRFRLSLLGSESLLPTLNTNLTASCSRPGYRLLARVCRIGNYTQLL